MERGKNPHSLANLRPARPGEMRNPEGINRKRPITDHYWEASQEPMPMALIQRFNRKWGKGMLRARDTWARGVAVRAFCEAVFEGNIRAAKEIRESIEGKSPQRLEITTPPKTEITLRVIHDRRTPRGDINRDVMPAAMPDAAPVRPS